MSISVDYINTELKERRSIRQRTSGNVSAIMMINTIIPYLRDIHKTKRSKDVAREARQ